MSASFVISQRYTNLKYHLVSIDMIHYETGGIYLKVQFQYVSGETDKIRKEIRQSTQSRKFSTVTCQERFRKIFLLMIKK
jgi:hypothetical protein